MYQAIVFLPLIGAIIAALITLVGARRRHPGGEPGAHEHVHETRYGFRIHDDHDDHEHAPAEGSQAAEIITSGLLVLAAILSWVAFFTVAFATPAEDLPQRVQILHWFASQTLEVDWAIRVDTLTVVMLVVVTTVSSLVHIYSIGYMAHDPYKPRFFAYLSMFTFAMLALVTADNLVQLYFGWEGVGLASYLLIGFWYQRPAANAAAIKAFIVNRIGDFGFALGIFAVFLLFSSVDYDTIFANASTFEGRTMRFLSWDLDTLTVVCLLLFMGAMGKSAQFLLHTWLPDAMEGPTPVSALIHAATMVTAGVFMVARLSPLFELAPFAMSFVMFIGATTAFFAASVGLVQNDIKRVIAYSTCSQLGYMFVGMGAGAFGAGIFHLFTHGFFKALLFLGAGSVIHAVGGEQDIQKMGGLRNRIPITYWMMVIGTLALTGFPLTAGFFSKDAIIESAYLAHDPVASYAWLITVGGVLLTAFYSWRLIFLAFHGPEREPPQVLAHVHESPNVMLIPLYVLAAGSLLAGLAFFAYFIGDAAAAFWKGAVVATHHEAAPPLAIVVLPTVMMAIGTGLAAWFYLYAPHIPRELAERNDWLYRFLLNKWYFDELYDYLFVRPALWLGRFLWKRGDGWLIDGFGPDGVSARVLDVTQRVIRLQSGYLYHYAFAMLIGVAILITWLMFRG
jgi:NADH-quinone oxidoreductase subunit L